jgi:hypothetical protein
VAKKKTKKKAHTPNRIPKDVKPFVVRKFRTKDRSKRVVVVRLPQDQGYNVQTMAKGKLVVVRDFSVPPTGTSGIPTPIWLSTQRELARWFAGHLSRNGQPPSARKERGRRKRYMKRATLAYNAHAETKSVVHKLKGRPKPTPPPAPRIVMPYICIYDPKQSCGDTTFRIHTAYCNKLDHERRKAIRDRGGDSWVIEAKTAEEAQAMQLKEFDENDMGYDIGDIHIHECEGD